MQITSCSVKFNRVSSYVPVLSTVVNLYDIFLKYSVFPKMKKEEVWNSHYYTHLDQKSYTRCIALLIPIIGNLIIAIYDFVNRAWNDKNFMLAAVKKDGLALKHASKELQNDKDVVAAAVKQKDAALRFASECLKHNISFWIMLVQENGELLQYACPEIQNNEEVVLAAVNRNGLSLKHASEKFQDNEKIVLAAVTQDPFALYFASPRLKDNKEVVLPVLKKRGVL